MDDLDVAACLHLQGVTSSYSGRQQQLWRIYLDRFSAMPQHPYWQNVGMTLPKPSRQVLIEGTWAIFKIKWLLFKLNALLENMLNMR